MICVSKGTFHISCMAFYKLSFFMGWIYLAFVMILGINRLSNTEYLFCLLKRFLCWFGMEFFTIICKIRFFTRIESWSKIIWITWSFSCNIISSCHLWIKFCRQFTCFIWRLNLSCNLIHAVVFVFLLIVHNTKGLACLCVHFVVGICNKNRNMLKKKWICELSAKLCN